MRKDFTFNGSSYALFPYDYNYHNYTSDNEMIVMLGAEEIGRCVPLQPIFCYQSCDFEEIMHEFAPPTETRTIREVLADLDVDVTGMNDFLIIQTI